MYSGSCSLISTQNKREVKGNPYLSFIWEQVYDTLTKYKYEILELKPYLEDMLKDNDTE